MNPGYGGGLVGRLYPADPRKEGEKCLVSWLEWIFQITSSLQLESKNLAGGRKFPLTAWTSSCNILFPKFLEWCILQSVLHGSRFPLKGVKGSVFRRNIAVT